MRLREKRAVIAVTAQKYRKARKKEKGAILEHLIELTGYAKRYAAWLPRRHGKQRRQARQSSSGTSVRRQQGSGGALTKVK